MANRVGEPEGWVAFDGVVTVSDFAENQWQALIDRLAPRYWDLDMPDYKAEIELWRSAPQMFVSLSMVPERIRSGA